MYEQITKVHGQCHQQEEKPTQQDAVNGEEEMWVDGTESQFEEAHSDAVEKVGRTKKNDKARTEKTEKMLQEVLEALQTKEREIGDLQFKQQMTERELALRSQQQLATTACSQPSAPPSFDAGEVVIFNENADENFAPSQRSVGTYSASKDQTESLVHRPLQNLTNIV